MGRVTGSVAWPLMPLIRRRPRARRVAVAAALVAALLPVNVPAAVANTPATAGGGRPWVGTWETTAQAPMGPTWQGPNWSQEGFGDHSLRQVVRISIGGPAVRIRVSNGYGQAPLRLTGATVAKAAQGAAVQPGTLRRVTFGHAGSTVVPVGGETFSDAVPLRVAPLDRLTVTLYFAGPTGPATFHEFTAATMYRALGDRLFDETAGAYTQTGLSWYYLSGIDVARQKGAAEHAVVIAGDSITDGVGASRDTDNRWPDELAERLVAAHRPIGVLNAGLAGNRVLNDAPCFGERLTARFDRDVLDQSGVRTVIVLEGINDIGAPLWIDPCLGSNPVVTADQLIQGYRMLIRAAHTRGIKIIGATILPFKGGGYYSEQGEQTRAAVNQWMRDSGEFDAIVDLDKAVADPNDPTRMRADYNGGDGIHPNDAGYHAMAAAVDLGEL
jgi:lysophospholipase L1-like esterase